MDFEIQRQNMVESQIRARGVESPDVLSALLKVPRHLFVPESHRDKAYHDGPLPIGNDQTISQPYIVALMTELLKISHSDKILEIGTGCGYQTAVLAELAAEVCTIEVIEKLQIRAMSILKDLGYGNIRCRVADGRLGWPEEAPFNRIIVTAASRDIPPVLVEQLQNGGRMVIPVGAEDQELLLIRKDNDRIHIQKSLSVRFVPLIHHFPS